jgi:glucosamine kinase
LRDAVLSSVGEALRNSGSPSLDEVAFASAEFGMTGGADFKDEIIRDLVKADHLVVDHDAPTALFGSTAGRPGIVVIAGTGSVIYGENEAGKRAKIGGLGYLFSDEGSGFWFAAQTIRLAIKEQDGLIPECGLQRLVLGFFGHRTIRDLTNDFYNEKISRDDLARLAEPAQEAARTGNEVLRRELEYGVRVLVKSVKTAAADLALTNDLPVAGVGGMFRGELMRSLFAETLAAEVPFAAFIAPRFGPAIGALLVAYRNAGVPLEPGLLENLERTSTI